jgi:hypothetical protein
MPRLSSLSGVRCSVGCPSDWSSVGLRDPGGPRGTQGGTGSLRARLSARWRAGRSAARRHRIALRPPERNMTSRASRSILRWTSAPASFPPRLCQTRNKRGLFIELGLEHNVNVVRCVMRPSVPRGLVLLPRVASRLSTVHDPVITPKTVVLRSLFAHRADPSGAKLSRPPSEPRWLCRVAKRRVASASPQSPKPSIGPAMADLRRAAAAEKCARLAARLADLAGPGDRRLGAARMSVAQYSCWPPTGGAHWVALSEAAAAIVRSLPPPAPRTGQARQSRQSAEDD